jgi:hypothetical protein
MCRPVRCRVCGNTTWAGCGRHVAQVRSMVPSDLWCAGHAEEEYAAASRAGWLSRVLGR